MGPNGYTLTEHYDLLSTVIYHHKTALDCELSQKIGDATHFRQLTKADLVGFSQEIGLPEKIAVNEINKLTKKIVIEFDSLYKIVENWPDSTNKPGDLKMLREIKHLVLLEMISKII